MATIKNLVDQLIQEYKSTGYDSYETVVVDNEIIYISYSGDGLFVAEETEYGWSYDSNSGNWELYQPVWWRNELNQREINFILHKEYTINLKIKY